MVIVSSFSERLAEVMNGMGVTDLAVKLGVSKQAVSAWLNGTRQPKQLTLSAIAQILSVDPAWLMGYDVPMQREYEGEFTTGIKGIEAMPKMRKIPILGTIACGSPIYAEQNFEGEAEVPDCIKADFVLKCKGDSMIDFRISDGDIVYIRKQPQVDNGDIAAVLIGNEATLKRFYFENGTMTLIAGNSKYLPITRSGESLAEVRVLGKVVGFTSTNV